jgi:hypothetical protein
MPVAAHKKVFLPEMEVSSFLSGNAIYDGRKCGQPDASV